MLNKQGNSSGDWTVAKYWMPAVVRGSDGCGQTEAE